MVANNIINQDALQNHINNEVSRLTKINLEEFKKDFLQDLSKNYFRDDFLLSRNETAKKLNISVRTLDEITKNGSITSVAVRRSVKFKNSDVLQYINGLK